MEYINPKKDIFLPRELWQEYSLMDYILPLLKPKQCGIWVRYGIWPFRPYTYQGGNVEPVVLHKKYIFPKFYIWNRSIGVETPPSGWKSYSVRPRLTLGTLEIRDDTYAKVFSKTLRNERNRWLRDEHTEYDIKEVLPELFFSKHTMRRPVPPRRSG